MGNRRRPQRRLRQHRLFRRKAEDAATRTALGTPEIRGQIETLKSIELRFHNGAPGPARRTLVLKVMRGLEDEFRFELRQGDHGGVESNSQEC